ncbi:hypothetical protein [Rheinheimera sp. UJ63]|uniref:hypothetical protein n=1 Tax=Rheinheimera sp. UJ63 TaxID=2910157 RepID=UPI001F1D2896|nr:hypothetical protein [Rheinheimera sp. UJ63]MCF4010640.1 hypothetical protein [Rheinheimera sp. UJ63]
MRVNEAGRIYNNVMSISVRTHGREKMLTELNEALAFMSNFDDSDPVMFDGSFTFLNIKEAKKHIKIRADRLINIEKIEDTPPLSSQHHIY